MVPVWSAKGADSTQRSSAGWGRRPGLDWTRACGPRFEPEIRLLSVSVHPIAALCAHALSPWLFVLLTDGAETNREALEPAAAASVKHIATVGQRPPAAVTGSSIFTLRAHVETPAATGADPAHWPGASKRQRLEAVPRANEPADLVAMQAGARGSAVDPESTGRNTGWEGRGGNSGLAAAGGRAESEAVLTSAARASKAASPPWATAAPPHAASSASQEVGKSINRTAAAAIPSPPTSSPSAPTPLQIGVCASSASGSLGPALTAAAEAQAVEASEEAAMAAAAQAAEAASAQAVAAQTPTRAQEWGGRPVPAASAPPTTTAAAHHPREGVAAAAGAIAGGGAVASLGAAVTPLQRPSVTLRAPPFSQPTDGLQALTIRQPFASAIIEGIYLFYISIDLSICLSVGLYIYIYLYLSPSLSLSIYILYIYIYIYIYESHMERPCSW